MKPYGKMGGVPNNPRKLTSRVPARYKNPVRYVRFTRNTLDKQNSLADDRIYYTLISWFIASAKVRDADGAIHQAKFNSPSMLPNMSKPLYYNNTVKGCIVHAKHYVEVDIGYVVDYKSVIAEIGGMYPDTLEIYVSKDGKAWRLAGAITTSEALRTLGRTFYGTSCEIPFNDLASTSTAPARFWKVAIDTAHSVNNKHQNIVLEIVSGAQLYTNGLWSANDPQASISLPQHLIDYNFYGTENDLEVKGNQLEAEVIADINDILVDLALGAAFDITYQTPVTPEKVEIKLLDNARQYTLDTDKVTVFCSNDGISWSRYGDVLYFGDAIVTDLVYNGNPSLKFSFVFTL